MKKISGFQKILLTLLIFASQSFTTPSVASEPLPNELFAQEKVDRFNAYLFPTLGQGKSQDWFEWWYTKVVEPKSGRAFFFVYGVVNPWDHKNTNPHSRAHVSFGSFSERLIVEKTVNPSEFTASSKEYSVQIGAQPFARATADRIEGILTTEDGREVSWNLTTKKEWSFRAMGWAQGIPNLLNIGWYPAQASTRISGTIKIGNETIEFDNVQGYQDRNWGHTFPKWWTWVVANRFDQTDDATLVMGGGAPEILGHPSPYEGVSIGFRYHGKVFTFRPTEGVFPKSDISFGKWEVSAKDLAGNRIEISASAPLDQFMDLQFMTPQGVLFHDYETLNGQLKLRFKPRGEAWIELTSSETGIEYGTH